MKEEMMVKQLTFDELLKLVMDSEVNKRHNFSKFFYKFFKIDFDNCSYSWTLERNYYVSGSVGYVYPSKNSTDVKTFKTEKGAKRNLVKYLEFLRERYEGKTIKLLIK